MVIKGTIPWFSCNSRSCHDVLFKSVKTVEQDGGTETGEGVISGLTPMFPGCHCSQTVPFISHIVREPDIQFECKWSMPRNHFSWPRQDKSDGINILGEYSFLSTYVLPFEKLQIFYYQKTVTQPAASFPFPLLMANKSQSSGDTYFCGANCNYSKLIKCSRKA